MRPMVNTFDMQLLSVALVDAEVVCCWFFSISSRSIFMSFYLIFGLLVIWLNGNCLFLIVFGYDFGLRINKDIFGFYGVDMSSYWYGFKARYAGDMRLMVIWTVRIRLSYLVQWLLDLVSLNQAQLKIDKRMVRDNVRLVSIVVWYKDFLRYVYVDITNHTLARRWVSLFLIVHTERNKCTRLVTNLSKMTCLVFGFIFRFLGLWWSFIIGRGVRSGAICLCWSFAGEFLIGLVSLHQVQRLYGIMKDISFDTWVKLHEESDCVSATRPMHTILMGFDVMSWYKIWCLDSGYWGWCCLVYCLYGNSEMIPQCGFLSLHCGRLGRWTFDTACTHILSLVSCKIMNVYHIIYIISGAWRRVFLCDLESIMVRKLLVSNFWRLFLVRWLKFQGIIKPKLNSSREPFYTFLK